MIYCNLSGLMANKKVNISDVARDTQISRTTLTSLYYNNCKGVQLDTADTLCKYFNVTMDRLFMHTKYDFNIEIEEASPRTIDYSAPPDAFYATVRIDVKTGNLIRTCYVGAAAYITLRDKSVLCDISLQYFDDSREERTYLERSFNAVGDVIKEHLFNLIVARLTERVSEGMPQGFTLDADVTNELW